MALINCPECNKETSSDRLKTYLPDPKRCYNCGFDLGRWVRLQLWELKQKDEAEDKKNKRKEAAKLRAEQLEQINTRKRLIDAGIPEINYNEFQKLIKKFDKEATKKQSMKHQVFLWVLCLSTIGFQIAFHIQWAYFLLLIPVPLIVSFIVFDFRPNKKELETVFGSVICIKYNYSWLRLSNYYREDLKYYSQFTDITKPTAEKKENPNDKVKDVNGNSNGQGTLTLAGGEKYVGEWKDDKRNGQGTNIYGKGPNQGEKYVGEWKDDKRNGKGTYTFARGEKYVGEWKDDKRNGQGTNIYGKGPNQGEKYVGEWKDDKRNGKGTYTFAGGEKYVGEWKDDKRNGKGTATLSDGEVYKGLWENDNFLGE